jgi:prepilin-type N-terminal cleavage/methylation domain-containing protein
MCRRRHNRAFTLIELLVVISILGMLAAIVVPAIKNFGRAEAIVAASRQLLDDIGRARQIAISQRTTVYMVFMPAAFWSDLPPGYARNGAAYLTLPPVELNQAARLFDKQLNSYTFFTQRGVGDQPGRDTPRYLDRWRSLPDGTFIAPWKFTPPRDLDQRFIIETLTNPVPFTLFPVKNFSTNAFPFPFADSTAKLWLPYVAFNYLGQLTSKEDEFIPLARGAISHVSDPQTKIPLQLEPSVSENPPNSSIDSFNLLHIDWLTGRARIERPQIQ